MDHDETDLESCALLIEDLKSEDPEVKINAVTKLHTLAALLGKFQSFHTVNCPRKGEN